VVIPVCYQIGIEHGTTVPRDTSDHTLVKGTVHTRPAPTLDEVEAGYVDGLMNVGRYSGDADRTGKPVGAVIAVPLGVFRLWRTVYYYCCGHR